MKKNNDIESIIGNDIKKKPLNKKNKVKIAVTLLCIFLLYSTILLVKLLKNPTETFIVEQGKIYSEESVTGYILRDEQVVENEDFNREDCSDESRREKSSKGRSYI